jgi:hypothetical protein
MATWRSELSLGERAFVAWMAPRGIVAGATASAFGLQLSQQGIAGGEEVLPIVFVAIFGTVLLYGLTSAPVAGLLGVAGAGGRLALIVGGHNWAREIGAALERAGIGVRLWTGDAAEQAAAQAAGLEADRGRMMVDAVSREAELEEITDALLLTSHDDFNALAAAELRIELGHNRVQRLAPDPEAPALLPPEHEYGLLPTYAEMERRFAEGARVVVEADGATGGFRLGFESGLPRAGAGRSTSTPDRAGRSA